MSVFFDPFRSLTNEPFGQHFGSALLAGGSTGIPGLLSLWNAKTPTISAVGPKILTSAAGLQPDADGNMVPWPVNHPGRGVMVQPAYSNLLQNSKFEGAVSGSPGTAATNWSNLGLGIGGSLVYSATEKSVRFTATAARQFWAQSLAVEANSNYRIDCKCFVYGDAPLASIADQCAPVTPPAGSTTAYELDGVSCLSTTVVPAGSHELAAILTTSVTAGTTSWRIGIGVGGNRTGDIKIWDVQVAKTAHKLLYAATGAGATAAVSSTAGYATDVGAWFNLTPRIKDLLSNGSVPVVAVGDSITTGDYPTHLWGLLAKSRIVDAGVNGNKTSDVLLRLATDVIPENPAAVTLLVGINDLIQGVTQATIQANILLIVERLVTAGIFVVVSTLTPCKGYANWSEAMQTTIDEINTWILTTVDALDGVAAVDNYTPLEDPANLDALLPAYDYGDHLHPGDAADPVIAGVFAAAIPWESIGTPRTAAPFTMALLVYMGAGSTELPNPTSVNHASLKDSTSDIIYSPKGAGGDSFIMVSYDGTTVTGLGSVPWDRGEIHLKIVETNQADVPNPGDAASTKFRAGNMRFTPAMVPIDEAPVYGDWSAYDDNGMAPKGKLRFGYSSTIPLGFIQYQLWNKSASDAEILKVLEYAL